MHHCLSIPFKIKNIEVRLLELPMHRPFKTANGETALRELSVLRVETSHGIGWGECSALPDTTYFHESAQSSYQNLADIIAPLVLNTEWTLATFAETLAQTFDTPMALAGLEMALFDAILTAEDISLATCLGTTRKTVPAGAVTGLGDTDTVLQQTHKLVDAGYQKIKYKILPNTNAYQKLRLVTSSFPDLEVQVDANGSYTAETADQLKELVELPITAFEQPFTATDLTEAQVFADSLPTDTFLVADEAASSYKNIINLLSTKAATAIALKPSRLGGIMETLKSYDYCTEQNIPVSAGGMVESGLGRHSLATFATLDGFTIPGDVSPASQWIAQDPWPDLLFTAGNIVTPTTAGVAPTPDIWLLEQLTKKKEYLSS